MDSRDLQQLDPERTEPASNEVQFALVIARMIDTVAADPEQLRQAVYDLARYKLQEQFTLADAREVKRTQAALEAAIRGVEDFSRQQVGPSLPPAAPKLARDYIAARDQAEAAAPAPAPALAPVSAARLLSMRHHQSWPVIKRTMALLLVGAIAVIGISERERLMGLGGLLRPPGRPAAPEVAQAPAAVAPQPAAPGPPPPPDPLRPTDYGIYAVGEDALTELALLPGRPPDSRVAVSAAFQLPRKVSLPNGHPKFIVFRKEAASNVVERTEVRVVARIARDFSAEAAGRRPDDNDESWVIRNFAYAFRASPIADNDDMYELHSEDPSLELPPGRYALILKSQAYFFSVDGKITDPRQCIERIVATTGTFYTDCKKL